MIFKYCILLATKITLPSSNLRDLLISFYCYRGHGIQRRRWSRPSPAIYAFFFLFQNKDSLVPQMGNVIAIGLTPSRMGIVIGPLLNAQLRHMSVRAAWRHK